MNANLTLPYSDNDLETLSRVVYLAKSRLVIDPRKIDQDMGLTVASCLEFEQNWVNFKLSKYHKRQAGIVVGIYESLSELQAFAIETRDEPQGFIALSFALITALQNYFNRALAHPDILTDYGNPENEERPTSADLSTSLYIAPKDPERRAVCSTLARMGIRFLVAHEMTHILHGHVRLLLRNKATFVLAESPIPLSEEDTDQTNLRNGCRFRCDPRLYN